MESKLSRELLKAHNDSESNKDSKKEASHHTSTESKQGERKFLPHRERTSTMQSEYSASTGTGIGKLKLFKLKNKIKLFGGSLSKSGSESQIQHRYENTYRTQPRDENKFSSRKAEDIIHGVLEAYLKGKLYDPKKFPNLCKSLAELIKERVKGTGCQRYKIISHVMILENQGQCMRHVSRCLWNKELDNYATASFETKDFIAVGTVFGSYYD